MGTITYPWANFSGGLAKPPLKLGHGWIISSQRKLWCIITYTYHDIRKAIAAKEAISLFRACYRAITCRRPFLQWCVCFYSSFNLWHSFPRSLLLLQQIVTEHRDNQWPWGWLQTEPAQFSSLHPILNTLPLSVKHTRIYYNHSAACGVIRATVKIYQGKWS